MGEEGLRDCPFISLQYLAYEINKGKGTLNGLIWTYFQLNFKIEFET